MKKSIFITIILMLAVFSAGCKEKEEPETMHLPGSGKTVGKDILMEDITDFYYTEENINYGAYYQRYRFYVEDGKHMFFHETRERKDDYGPCTEDDTTLKGTAELTDEQWSQFYDLVNGGTVKARSDSADSGDTGPWLYLYWTDDKSKYQEFSFDSYNTETRFVDYCISLIPDSQDRGSLGEEREMTPVSFVMVKVGDRAFTINMEDTQAAREFFDEINSQPLVITMHDFGSFEKVGDLPFDLPADDEEITTVPGDLILYQGNKITIYYDENTWNFTKLGHLNAAGEEILEVFGGKDDITAEFFVEWSE
ncbi:MAG: hypothetical protein K6F34_00120 [Lachnospiraceae bacterium]|nr:hypothetical protein [Lachnospiraceae bacterium]